MLQARGDFDLAQEPLAAQRDCNFGPQCLERDEALVARVTCEIHEGHAATAQLPIDDVVWRERSVQFCKCVSHSVNDSSDEPAERAPGRGPKAAREATGRL